MPATRASTPPQVYAPEPADRPGNGSYRSELWPLVAVQQFLVPRLVTDELLTRGRQAIQHLPPRQTGPARPPLDPAQSSSLLARAKAAVGVLVGISVTAQSPNGRPKLVRLSATCGANGGAFIVMAERIGDHLLFVGSKSPRTREEAEASAALSAHQYNIDIKSGWTCPICRSSTSWQVWTCHCELGQTAVWRNTRPRPILRLRQTRRTST